MAPLNVHARQLYTDLGNLAEGGALEIGKPLANVYNLLLEEAKNAAPEEKMLGALTPVGEGMNPRVLQGLTGQLLLALGKS